MANQTRFFLMLIILLQLTLACSVQVTIVLSPALLPYYEWLTSFPTRECSPPQPIFPFPMEEQGYRYATGAYQPATTLSLPGNIIVLP